MDKEAEETTLYSRLILLFINVTTKIVFKVFTHYAVQTIDAVCQTNETAPSSSEAARHTCETAPHISEDALQTSLVTRQSCEDERQTSEDGRQIKEDVKAFLFNHETRRQLQELHRKNILSDLEFLKVTANNPRVEEFDISLLIILLCNLFCGTIKPPEKGWRNKKPPPTDLTLGADLIRLRNYRNKLFRHPVCARIFVHLFNDYWKDLETILVRICRNICPSEEYNIKEEIRACKIKILDQKTEHWCREKIEDFQKICKDIVELQEQVEKLISKTKGLLSEGNNGTADSEEEEHDQDSRDSPDQHLSSVFMPSDSSNNQLCVYSSRKMSQQIVPTGYPKCSQIQIYEGLGEILPTGASNPCHSLGSSRDCSPLPLHDGSADTYGIPQKHGRYQQTVRLHIPQDNIVTSGNMLDQDYEDDISIGGKMFTFCGRFLKEFDS